MDQQFEKIAASLKPSGVFMKAAKGSAHEVFENLRQFPDVSVARVLIAGSIGKKTALNEDLFEIDFDLVVFVNKRDDQKEEDVLKKCLNSLEKLPGFAVQAKIHNNLLQFSLPVKVEGKAVPVTVDFDLVVAANYGDGQVAETMKKIEENPDLDTIHHFGPGLSIETVGLINELAKGKIRDIIRVAKFWDKSLKNTFKWQFIAGRSYLIELIAIAASLGGGGETNNQVNQNQTTISVYDGFVRFLEKMGNLGTLNVVFAAASYKVDQIPDDVRKQRPLVMDPVNYCYNVAAKMGQDSINKYQEYARKSLQKLPSRVSQQWNLENFHEMFQ